MIYLNGTRMVIKILLALAVMMLITMACQPPAHSGELELGWTANTGASHTETYIAGLEHNLGRLSLDASYRYGETDNVPTTDQGYVSLIYAHEFSSRWSVEGGNKVGFNNIQGIDTEDFLGFGPKYYIVEDVLSLSVWYLLHYTDYRDRASETTRRLSIRTKMSVKDESTETRVVFSYQPNVDDTDDYITILEASYRVAFKDNYTLKVAYEEEFRSAVEDVQRETLQYISLTVGF